MKSNLKKRNANTAVLYSAALQDHFLKKNNFTLGDNINQSQTKTSKLPCIYRNKHDKILAKKEEMEIKQLENKEKASILPYES